MLRVFVALGKQLPKNKAIIEDTKEVARLLAKYNCTMVQGGARMGLMGEVVDEFQKYSDDVVMIVPEVHKSDLEGTIKKEYYIVEGEADRLKLTIKTCDLLIVLPGGTGTLAELAFYNETRKSGEQNAKLVMVNTKGFYNKLIQFYKYQTKMGFMKKEHFMFEVINSANQLELIIQQLIAEKQALIQKEQINKQKQVKTEDKKQVAKKTEKKVASKTTKATTKKSTTKTETTKPETKKSVTKTAKPKAVAPVKNTETAKKSVPVNKTANTKKSAEVKKITNSKKPVAVKKDETSTKAVKSTATPKAVKPTAKAKITATKTATTAKTKK